MNFVVLGNVCIDKNKIDGKFYEAGGGSPVFINKFLNNMKDASVTTTSSYGRDFIPYKNGLELYPRKPNVLSTLVYENVVKNGKRAQKCHFYNQFPPKIDAEMTECLKRSDVLFIAPLIPSFEPEYIENAAMLNKNSLKILLPQGYFRDFDRDDRVIFGEFKEAERILPLFDVVILSTEDYPDMESLAIEWSKKYGTVFIITMAEKGAQIVKGGIATQIPTNPIDDFNPIGAGDTFAAAFGYYYSKSKDLKKSVEFANKAASIPLTIY